MDIMHGRRRLVFLVTSAAAQFPPSWKPMGTVDFPAVWTEVLAATETCQLTTLTGRTSIVHRNMMLHQVRCAAVGMASSANAWRALHRHTLTGIAMAFSLRSRLVLEACATYNLHVAFANALLRPLATGLVHSVAI
jgi:energy-converting hydrogenase Eha subunit C